MHFLLRTKGGNKLEWERKQASERNLLSIKQASWYMKERQANKGHIQSVKHKERDKLDNER